jgi:hypothetical protein
MELGLHVGMSLFRYRRLWRYPWRNTLMELGLQFGYGMMEHCRNLIAAWGGGTVVLSPRDLNGEQLVRLASSLNQLPNARVLLDPQVYLPHSDHERLCSHDYWPQDYETGGFWQGTGVAKLVGKLSALNVALGTSAFVLPGLLAATVNDDWLAVQQIVLDEARTADHQQPLYMTVALSADAAKDQDQIAALLEASSRWDPVGYYIVCEHPNGAYLVEDPDWLANVLDLVAGLKLAGKRVVLGYCNHQMLLAASAKADVLCSGTWMNVRSFPPDKFRAAYDEEIKQRATWYYCPQALSEYKIPFLDIAHRVKLLSLMAPSGNLASTHADPLFSGSKPSSVGFTEQAAFRHYLQCLRAQCNLSSLQTFDDTVSEHERLLNDAESIIHTLSAAGVRGQLRDFNEIIDVNRAALSVLTTTRGPILRRAWASL